MIQPRCAAQLLKQSFLVFNVLGYLPTLCLLQLPGTTVKARSNRKSASESCGKMVALSYLITLATFALDLSRGLLPLLIVSFFYANFRAQALQSPRNIFDLTCLASLVGGLMLYIWYRDRTVSATLAHAVVYYIWLLVGSGNLKKRETAKLDRIPETLEPAFKLANDTVGMVANALGPLGSWPGDMVAQTSPVTSTTHLPCDLEQAAGRRWPGDGASVCPCRRCVPPL